MTPPVEVAPAAIKAIVVKQTGHINFLLSLLSLDVPAGGFCPLPFSYVFFVSVQSYDERAARFQDTGF